MEKIFFQITPDDADYVFRLKAILGGKANVRLNTYSVTAVYEVVMRAKEYGTTKIATTSSTLLKLLLTGTTEGKTPSLDDYAGSIIEKFGCEFLILNPMEHLVTVSYGKFLYERYFNKFIKQEQWLQLPEFKWELFDPAKTEELIDWFASCTFIACDIETGDEVDRVITCNGFTGVKLEDNKMHVRTVVVPFNDMYNVMFIKMIYQLEVAKVFQNGQYDNAYLLRFDIPVSNWAFDTQSLFHSWYSEFPKRLDFITSFMLRKWQFWKDESNTFDLMQYYGYNAKDCFTTAMDFLAIIIEAPDYVFTNFLAKFPLNFACLMAAMRGIKRDQEVMNEELKRFETSLELQLASMRKMVSNDKFNPGSPQQTVRLFEVLGSGDIKSSGKAKRDKVMARHPLNKRLLKAVEKYREDRKLVSGYLKDEWYEPKYKRDRTKTWNGRVFFSLSPDATDTGRLASKESAFWCGWQIQNIPRDRKDIQVKRGIVSDYGFYFGECDYEQNEARGTAFLSGDTNLIKTVSDTTRDFHGINASGFFGVPYDKIVNSYQSNETLQWIHKTIDKELRDLSKRTNHGSNYNMGAGVMLDTMGIENVIRARDLLKLPRNWTLLQVTQHLLNVYAETYPVVKKDWYDKVKADVKNTGYLVGPTGWTRRCFGDPTTNKRDLNAYVAHPPQSLAAQVLNKAYMRVFYRVALANPVNFKLGPQIHDSILFQYRIGHEYLAWQVKQCMEIPVDIKDTFGITRTLTVPVALKGEATRWSELKDEVPEVKCPIIKTWNDIATRPLAA